MKSSNLAERLDPQEPQTCAPGTQQVPARHAADVARAPPRPRRSLEFRAIMIRDQGFTPFRVS